MENNPEFVSNFSVVIATDLKEKTVIQLSAKLWDLDIPFLNCKSYGFLGYIRSQIKEHTVIESHPDNQHPDLRLDKPFPSLVQHINSVKLEEMELKDHAHVPYLIILYKYLQVCYKKDFRKITKFKNGLEFSLMFILVMEKRNRERFAKNLQRERIIKGNDSLWYVEK